MGILFNRDGNRKNDDYRDVTEASVDASAHAGTSLHFATVENVNDLIPVKDALHDGGMVIADVSGLNFGSRRWERIEDEVSSVTADIGGDAAIDGDRLILVPSEIHIEKGDEL